MNEQEKSEEATVPDWVSRIVSDERTKNPLMNDDFFVQLDSLLKGQMADRALTPAMLKKIASDLLECNSVDFQQQEGSQ